MASITSQVTWIDLHLNESQHSNFPSCMNCPSSYVVLNFNCQSYCSHTVVTYRKLIKVYLSCTTRPLLFLYAYVKENADYRLLLALQWHWSHLVVILKSQNPPWRNCTMTPPAAVTFLVATSLHPNSCQRNAVDEPHNAFPVHPAVLATTTARLQPTFSEPASAIREVKSCCSHILGRFLVV